MTKYVVKMDYCTMAFTAGTCSLQALSNCLAGDTDLHWMQIYNSEKSPYHSPLGLYYNDACGSVQNPHVARISGVGCEHFPLLFLFSMTVFKLAVNRLILHAWTSVLTFS